MTILLDVLTGGGGTIAVICSTLGIVVFGEIIPQVAILTPVLVLKLTFCFRPSAQGTDWQSAPRLSS